MRPLLATRADSERFVGRAEELAQLLANVDARANTLVLAERGAGLTSFLNRAMYELEARDDVRVVALTGEIAQTGDELLAVIEDRLASGSAPDASSRLVPGAAGPTIGGGSMLLWRVDRLARLAASIETKVVVVIDGVGSAGAAHTVFGQLRNELWQMETIAWVLGGAVGQRGRYLEPPADAFWESVIELPPLGRNDLFAILVRHELAFPNDLRDAVLDWAEGNPMKLLLAARTAEEGQLPGQPERDMDLGEAAARLMYYLEVNGPASASDAGLLGNLGWSRGRAQQVFKELEDAGLVTGEMAPTDGAPGRPRKLYRLTSG